MLHRIIIYLLIGVASLLGVSTAYAESPVLEIVACNYPPYELATPEDGLRGFDLEVVKEALSRAGYKTNFTFYPWARAYKMTAEGKAFAALSCSYKAEREHEIIWTMPISSMTDIYVVRSDYTGNPVVNKFVIAEEKLAFGNVKGNYVSEQWEGLGVTVDLSSSEELLMRKLLDGRVDVIPQVKENYLYYVKKKGLEGKFKIFEAEDNETSKFHLCISKKSPMLKKYELFLMKNLAKCMKTEPMMKFMRVTNNSVL